MVKMIGSFEDVIEKGQSAVRDSAKSAQKSAQNFASTAKGQIVGGSNPSTQSDQGTNEQGNLGQQQMSDDDAKKFLQDLYGVKNSNQNDPSTNQVPQNPISNMKNVKTALGFDSSKAKVPTTQETIKNALGLPGAPKKEPEKIPQSSSTTIKDAMGISKEPKDPEERAKLESLRNQLHGAYFQELVKPKEEEERVTEKMEREEQVKQMEELEEQKKKPPPLPATVKQGTGENVVGVSG